MEGIIFLLSKYIIFPVLIIVPVVLFFIIIYHLFNKNKKNHSICSFMKGHYFKIKFKLTKERNSYLEKKAAAKKIKISFYKKYLWVIGQIILLCGSPKESFEILKEDLEEKHGKVVKITIEKDGKKEVLNMEEVFAKLKEGSIKDFDFLEELSQKLFQLHEKKQKNAIKLSLLSLTIIVITTVVTGLITSFLFPKVFKSYASSYSLNQSSWEGGETTNTAAHPVNQIGWTEYSLKDENIEAGTELKLLLVNSSITIQQPASTEATGEATEEVEELEEEIEGEVEEILQEDLIEEDMVEDTIIETPEEDLIEEVEEEPASAEAAGEATEEVEAEEALPEEIPEESEPETVENPIESSPEVEVLGEYFSSETFTSSINDTGQYNVLWGDISWNAVVPENTEIILKIKTGDTDEISDVELCDEIATITPENQSGSVEVTDNSCVVAGHRYVKYYLDLISYEDTAIPELEDISFSFSYYPSQILISSPYNSTILNNSIEKIEWEESLEDGTDIKFQIKTAHADEDLEFADWLGPNGADDYYTDPSGADVINSSHNDGENDQWFQYKVFLVSGGLNTPTFSGVTITYAETAEQEEEIVASSPVEESLSEEESAPEETTPVSAEVAEETTEETINEEGIQETTRETTSLTWDGEGANNNWSTCTNWSGDICPISGDDIIFDSTNAKNSTFDYEITVNNFSIDGYNGTISMEQNLAIAGDLTLNSGVLSAGSNTITVGGNWINGGGNFSADSSTVEINNADKISTITGDNIFYNFKCLTPTKRIQFTAESTQTILGQFKILGDYAKHVRLISAKPGEQWKINPQGQIDIDYGWVADSDNLNGQEIIMEQSTNRGGCTGWDPTGTWTNGNSTGIWSDGLNWDGFGGVEPGAGDTVVFDGTSVADSSVDASFAGTVTAVNINSGYTGTVSLARSLTISGAFSQAAGTFNGVSYAITIGTNFTLSGGTFTSTSGELKVANDWTSNSGSPVFNANGGTVNLESSYLYSPTHTPGTIIFNNVILYASGDARNNDITIVGTMNVDGDLTLSASNFAFACLDGGAITVAGDVTIASDNFALGSYGAGTATITLDGTEDQTIAGNATGHMPYVVIDKSSGTLNLTGTVYVTDWTWTNGTLNAGTSTLVLKPGHDRSSLVFTPGTVTYNNFEVQTSGDGDSFGTLSGTMTLSGNLTFNGTNYTGQKLDGGTINVAGDYSAIGVWPGGTVAVNLNGTGSQTITQVDGTTMPSGTFTINKSSGTATFASAVSFNTAGQDLALTTGTLDLAGYGLTVNDQFTIGASGILKLYGDETISKAPTSNSGLVQYYGTSGPYTMQNWTYNDLQFSSASATTFNLPATITVNGDLTIDANSTLDATASNYDIALSGNWSNSGSFVDRAGTVTFNATTGTILITPGGTGDNNDFYDITFNDAAGSATYQLQGALDVNNDLTVTDGILDTKSGSNYAITVGNDWLQTGGKCTAQSSTITVAGDFTADGTESGTGYNSATVVLTGTGNLTYSNLSIAYERGFYNLTCGQSGNTTTLVDNFTIKNTLTIGSGTLTGSYSLTLQGATPLSFDTNSTLSINSLSFYRIGEQTIPSLNNGYDCFIDIAGNSGGTTVTQTGDVVINNNKLRIKGDTASRICTWITDGYDLTVGTYIQVGYGSDTNTKTLDASSGTGGNSTITVGTNWTVYDTGTAPAVFIADDSTVVFNGTADQTIATGGDAFYNLTSNNTGSSGSDDIIISGALDVNGLLTITDGDLDVSTNDPNVNLAGGVTVGASGTIDLSAYSGTWTYDGTGTVSLTDNTTTGLSYGAITVDGTSQVLQFASGANTPTLTFTTLTIGADDTVYLNGENSTITTLVNNGTFKLQGGETLAVTTMDVDTGTVTYVGDGDSVADTYSLADFGDTDYYNLIINSTDGVTDTYQLQGALVVANDLTVSDGTLDTKSGSDYAITVANDFLQTGGLCTAQSSTITAGRHFTADGTESKTGYNSATVVLTGTGNITYSNDGTYWNDGFYNLTCGQSGNMTTLLNHVAVKNVLTIGTGELTGGSSDIWLNGTTPLSFDTDNSNLSIGILKFWRGNAQSIPPLTNGYDCNIQITAMLSTNVVTQTGDIVLNSDKYLLLDGGGYTGRAGKWVTDGYDLTVGGYIQVGEGGDTVVKTLDASSGTGGSSTITVSGNWTVYDTGSAPAVFTAGDSTVVLNGTSQSILGATTFYNLTKTVTSADTLTFGDDTTQTISAGGVLTLQGASGELLSLRTVSDNGTAKFNINDGGTESVFYVNVKDGVATNSISAIISVDGGGNTNWDFPVNFVNSTADTLTNGTLRYALTNTPAGQTITFDTTVFPQGSPSTITVTSTVLPSITQGNITIDASDAGVIIDGTGLGAGIDGLTLASTGNTIKGLTISNFTNDGIAITSGDNTIGGTGANEGNQIYLNGDDGIDFSASSGTTTIVGNYIGTNTSYADLGNVDDGIYVNGQGAITIGGTAIGAENIIGFQDDSNDVGIYVNDGSPSIQGNYIGTNSSGADLANYWNIYTAGGADDVTIGGTVADSGNTIGRGINYSVYLLNSSGTTNVYGNYIGTDSSWRDLGGTSFGIVINGAGTFNIGGTDAGAGNWICFFDEGGGNGGIFIGNGSPTIQGNYIGTNSSGADLANQYGIYAASGADNVTIGGTAAGAGNIIRGGSGPAVGLASSSGTINVQGNYIGTDSSWRDLGGSDHGIEISSTGTYNIGGTDAGAGNWICYFDNNGSSGIYIVNGSPTIQGNYIGTNSSGDNLANDWGIRSDSNADNVTIGGTVAGAGNIIRGGAHYTVYLVNSSGTTNVYGNYIGTDSSWRDLGGTFYGIYINGAGTFNIGGAEEGAGNWISFFDTVSYAGIYVNDGSPTIQGNYIGTNSSDTDLGNYYGIYLASGADAVNIGGTASGAGNTISLNNIDGIYNASTNDSIVIQGNYIGTDAGSSSLPNGDDGIETTAGTITIGNASEITSNTIGPNTGYNINISNAAATVNFAGTVNITDDINFSAGTVGLGTATINITGDWTNATTMTTDESTVNFIGTTDQTVTTNNQSFYNFTSNNTGSSGSDDIIISGALDANGLLTITDGDLDVSTNDPNVNIAGGMTVSANGSIDLSAYSGTWTYDGSGTLTDNRSSIGDLGAFTIDGSSATLTFGSNIKATSISIAADDTLNLGAGSYTLELTGTGSPLTATGTFDNGTGSTVVYTGSGTATNIAAVPYNNLTLTPTSATTYNLAGNLTSSNAMSGNLTINSDATLDVRPVNTDYSITCVDITIDGVLDAASAGSTITASGNWDSSGGTFTYGESTVDLTGTGNLKTSASTWTSTSYFYNLNCAADTKTTTLQSTASAANVLTLGTGTITGELYRLFLFGNSGTPFVNSGATITLLGIVFRPSTGTITISGGDYGTTSYLTFFPTNNATINLGGDITNNGILFGYVSVGKSAILNTQNNNVTVNELLIGSSSSTGSFTYNLGSSVIDIGIGGLNINGDNSSHILNLETATITSGGPWELADGTGSITQNPGTATVTLDGTADQTITTNSQSFYNLTTNNTGSDGSDDIIISGALDVNGLLTITDGDLDVSTNDPNVNLAGGMTVGADGTIDLSAYSGTWTYDGTGTVSLTDNTTTGLSYGAITVDGTSQVLQFASGVNTPTLTFTTLTIGADDTVYLNGENSTITTLVNNGTFKLQGGETLAVTTMDVDTGTVTYVGDGDSVADTYSLADFGDTDYYNLIINSTDGVTDIFRPSTADLTIAGDYTLTAGTFTTEDSGTTDRNLNVTGSVDIDGTFTANSSTITVGTSWDSSGGTFTYGTSTATFNGTTAQTITGTTTWYNLTVNNTYATPDDTYDVDPTAVQTVAGTLTITDGQWTPYTGDDYNNVVIATNGIMKPDSSASITASGDWSNSGTFTHNDSIVILDGTSQSLTGSTTFYNLTKTVASADTLTFDNTSTQTIANTMILQGASSQLLSLRSDSDGDQWEIDPQGTRTIEYLDVKDSNNTNATAMSVLGLNITNSGNNTNWTFNTAPSVTFDNDFSTWQSGDITINYNIIDADSDTCNISQTATSGIEYSVDNTNWYDATDAGGDSDGLTGLASSPTTGTDHDFIWDSATDLASTEDATVYIRIRPNDGTVDADAWATSTSFGLDNVAPTSVGAPTFETVTSSSIIINKPTSVTENGSGLYQWQTRQNSLTELGFNGIATTTVTDSSLSENTEYTYDVAFTDVQSNTSSYGTEASAYTLIQSPAGVSWDDIGVDSITLSATGTLSNLTSGSSGLYFENTTAETNSDWTQTNSWANDSLEENTSYTFQITSRNGDGTANDAVSVGSKYTLAGTPTGLTATPSETSITLTVDIFPNVTSDSSGYYFTNTTNGTNSGWIQTNTWENLDLSCRTEYAYSVKYRNGEGVETATATASESTTSCGGATSPAVTRPPQSPSSSTTNPQGGFKIIINNDNEYANNKTVTLKLIAGSDVTKMAISNFADFRNATQKVYQQEIEWELTPPQPSPSKEGNTETVYAKFYTQYGQSSDIVSDMIILDETPPEKPVIIYPENSSIIKTDKPLLEGETEQGSKITLQLISGSMELVNTAITPEQNGKWSYQIPRAIADGNYQLKVSAKDLAQNTSETALSNFSILTFVLQTEPAEPTELLNITYPKDNSIITKDKPTLYGTAESGIFINLEISKETTILTKATIISNQWGEWYYYPTEPLADGNYQIKIYAKDTEQNIIKTVTKNFSIKKFIEPTEPVVEPAEPTEPVTEPTEPAEPTEPVTTEPTTEPTEPVVTEPTEPVVIEPAEPTEPVVQPAEPPVLPTAPAEKPEIPAQQEISGKTPSIINDISNTAKQGIGFVSNQIKKARQTIADAFSKLTPQKQTTPKPEEIAVTPEPKPIPTPEPQNIPEEKVVIKSAYGNIDLTPYQILAPNESQKEETKLAISTISNQEIRLFVKPQGDVLGVAGQILYNEASAQSEPANQSSTLSQRDIKETSFIKFLAPKIANAQETTTEPTQTKNLISQTGGWKIKEFSYADENKNGIFEAKINLPAAESQYTIRTIIAYTDGKIKSIDTPLAVDSQGYVYTKTKEGVTKIENANVTLFRLNEQTKKYEIFDSSSTNKKNPQATNQDGQYSFIVPAGAYYMTVEAKNYHSFTSTKFNIQDGEPINFNIELKKKFDWLRVIELFFVIIGLLAAGWYAGTRKHKNTKTLSSAPKHKNTKTK